MLNLNSKILDGNLIQLIPLQREHADLLLAAAEDGELWKLWYTSVPSEENMKEYINTALAQKEKLSSIPYVVVKKSSNTIIGTTRYCNIDSQNRRLEIGYSWYAASHQKTGVNTECKYLLLRNAFDELSTVAVEFRTHWHNHTSRNAILRLGAKQDGVLRSHRINEKGEIRDTVVYSIIACEWPTVKKSLEYKMSKY